MEDSDQIFPWLPPDFDLEQVMGRGWCGQVTDDTTSGAVLSDPLADLALSEYGSLLSPQCGDPILVSGDPASECDLSPSLLLDAQKFLQDNFPDLPMSPGVTTEALPVTTQHPDPPHSSATILDNLMGCQTNYPLDQGVPNSANRTGSRAFDYISSAAVLETHGIPAPSRLALLTDPKDGTVPFKNLAVDDKFVAVMTSGSNACVSYGTVDVGETLTVPNSASNPIPYGTVVDSKVTVPDRASSDSNSIPFSTVEPKITVPNSASKLIHFSTVEPKITVPNSASNLIPFSTVEPKITVPNSASNLIPFSTVEPKITVPNSASNLIPFSTVEPKITVPNNTSISHSAAYGTVPITTNLTGVPDSASNSPSSASQATPRKRRRRRGNEEGKQKVRKYEQLPLTDLLEERKRMDAIRAKRCRERNRQEMVALREELVALQKVKEGLAKEIVQRKRYESVICNILKEKTGIVVLPFAMNSDTMTPPQLPASG